MVIRPAASKDEVDVVERALARKSPYTSSFRPLSHYNVSGRILHLLAEVEGAFVGYVQFAHLKRKPHSIVYNIGVAPEDRRAGIGHALLNDVLKSSPHGAILLCVDPRNTVGQAFFSRVGFQVVGDRPQRRGPNLIEMLWRGDANGPNANPDPPTPAR